MGKLHDEVVRIEQIATSRNLDLFRVKGRIALRAGFPLLSIRPDTPDDVDKLQRLRSAAAAVLSES